MDLFLKKVHITDADGVYTRSVQFLGSIRRALSSCFTRGKHGRYGGKERLF